MSHEARHRPLMLGVSQRSLVILAVGLVALAGVGVAGWSWWRGRAERSLSAAERSLREGDAEAALGALGLPERAPSTRDRALIVHARAALSLKRVAEAARVLNRVDARGPLATELGYWKGRTLYEARQVLGAVHWFRWVLDRRPDDLEAHRWLAVAAYDLGDHPTAVGALETVTKLDPGDARAWRTLGLLYKEDVNHERAEAAFAASLRANPDQPEARLGRAEALVSLGRNAEAERELAACRGKVPEADRADLLAQCLLSRGDEAASRAVLDAALAAAPEHPGLLGQRARLDLAQGQAGRGPRAARRRARGRPVQQPADLPARHGPSHPRPPRRGRPRLRPRRRAEPGAGRDVRPQRRGRPLPRGRRRPLPDRLALRQAR